MTSSTPPSTGLRRRQIPKASDLLAEELRARIIAEGLMPGDALPSESALISDLGLSRATVREALRLLEADGLITIKRGPGGGVVVRHPDGVQLTRSLALLLALSQAPLRDLFAFRKVVEPAAAAAAARNATDDQRRQLEAAVDPEFRDEQARVDFHIIVAELSGNALYRLNLAVLQDLLDWHVRSENLSAEDVQATMDVHQKIAAAVISRDAASAERLMLKHLESFEAVMATAGRLDQPIIPPEQWLRHDGFHRASIRSARRENSTW